MAMRGFGSRFLRMSSRHDHVKNALNLSDATNPSTNFTTFTNCTNFTSQMVA